MRKYLISLLFALYAGTAYTAPTESVVFSEINLNTLGANSIVGYDTATGTLIAYGAGTGITINGGTISSSGAATWGSISGTLSNQTDLQNALNAKLGTTLASGNIYVGNGSNVATSVTMSGDVTLSNAGVAAIGAAKVTSAMLRNSAALSVIGRSANSTGVPADIAASAASDAVLRESGSTIGFGTIATGGIANNAVTFAKIQTIGSGSFLARSTAGTGNVEELTTAQVKTLLSISGSNSGDQTITLTGDVTGSGTGSFSTTIANDAVTFAKMQDIATNKLLGRSTAATGDIETISIGSGLSLAGGTLTATASSAWGGITGTLSDQTDLQAALDAKLGTSLTSGNIFVGNGSNVATGVAMSGDITISNAGVTAIGAAKVTSAMLRNSAALSVIGRSANSTGVPADIAAVAASDSVLRESGSTIGFGTIATGGISSNAVTFAKIQNISSGSFLARSTVGSGNVEELTTAQVKSLLSLSGTNTGDQTITLTGDVTGSGTGSFAATIANDSVTFAKMQNIATNRLLGRSTAASGDPEEISIGSGLSLAGGTLTATASSAWGGITGTLSDQTDLQAALDAKLSKTLTSGNIFVGNGSNVATGVSMSGDVTIDNAGATTIGAAKVTSAMLRNSGALSVIGRSANSAGVPADISAVAASDSVLRESGSTIGFGTIATGGIANNAVTFAKMQNIATSSLLGRSTAATGNVEVISVGSGLSLSAGTLTATGANTLTSGHIFVGNGSNVATDVAMSGDVTITNAGVTAIGAAKVTNAMLAGSITAANLVGTDIATVGTITSGTWHGGVIDGLYGGTGVANSGKTITLGGNLTTSGAFATTLTVTAGTNVTLPTTGTLSTLAGTETFTNKRVTPRIVGMADATSITPSADTADQNTHANTQATGTLTINAPSGTPTDGQKLILRIKSTNAHLTSWNAIYRGSTDVALPANLSGSSKTDYFAFIYNSADTKWDMVAKTQGF